MSDERRIVYAVAGWMALALLAAATAGAAVRVFLWASGIGG
jgi:hypothetical protein